MLVLKPLLRPYVSGSPTHTPQRGFMQIWPEFWSKSLNWIYINDLLDFNLQRPFKTRLFLVKCVHFHAMTELPLDLTQWVCWRLKFDSVLQRPRGLLLHRPLSITSQTPHAPLPPATPRAPPIYILIAPRANQEITFLPHHVTMSYRRVPWWNMIEYLGW